MNHGQTETGQRENRRNPRLRLSYPIEVEGAGGPRGTRGVTSNLSARGAYFKTFAWEQFQEGCEVRVRIEVPHPLQSQKDLIHLHLEAAGRVRRMDTVAGREALGEDGLALKGIALEFASPLRFNYFWS